MCVSLTHLTASLLQGHAGDAIEVYCNMETRETCVYPAPSESPRPLSYNRKPGQRPGYVWFSEMPQGFTVRCMLSSPLCTKVFALCRMHFCRAENRIYFHTLTQFDYKASKVQLMFLQMLSSEARQNVTYLCRNSVAYHDANRKSYNRSLKLMSYNDLEITAEQDYRTSVYSSKYTVIRDGCEVIRAPANDANRAQISHHANIIAHAGLI